MSSRYDIIYTSFLNRNPYYKFLMEKRGVKAIEQYPTPVIRNPTAAERSMLNVTQHIWSYGDRYYKLADQYYNDPKLWWVIAWYIICPFAIFFHTCIWMIWVNFFFAAS